MAFGRMGARGGFGGFGSSGGASIPAAPPNTLRAARGSFTLTGVDMRPAVDSRLPAAVGSFIETGVAANLILDRPMPAAVGSFALTGIDAALTKATPSAGPTFAFLGKEGHFFDSATVCTFTTVNIGTAAAGRFIICALADQNGLGLTSVTVGGVSLTQDKSLIGGGRGLYIWSGLVPTGSGVQNIVATTGGSGIFTDVNLFCWSGTGMATTTGAAITGGTLTTGGASASISVNAGDFLVLVTIAPVANGASTETPTATRTQLAGGSAITTQTFEWNKIIATNAAFSAAVATGTPPIALAAYR